MRLSAPEPLGKDRRDRAIEPASKCRVLLDQAVDRRFVDHAQTGRHIRNDHGAGRGPIDVRHLAEEFPGLQKRQWDRLVPIAALDPYGASRAMDP